MNHRPTPQIQLHEVHLTAIRAQGAGGQNVNKVSNAVHLRYDVRSSSLPDDVKARLLALADHRITPSGVVVIKAQEHRSLEQNRAEALMRLQALVDQAALIPRERKATRPSRAAREQRLAGKHQRSRIKAQRRASGDD